MYRMVLFLALPLGCAVFQGKQSALGDEPTLEDTGETDTNHSDTDDTNDTTDTTDTTDTNDTAVNFCDQEMSYAPNQGPCWTQPISCGQTIEMSLQGGLNYYDTTLYNAREWYCNTSFDGDYAGPERVFLFEHPGQDLYATAKLEGNCDNMALVAIRWDAEYDGCQTEDDIPNECNWSDKNGSQDESVIMYENNYTPWLIIVDSRDPSMENFRLTVTCE